MQKHEFDQLDDEKLIWTCVEPMIRNVRGKDSGTKLQAFLQLNNGQRALFQFQVLYGHANHGSLQFFQYLSYLTDALDIWSALKAGMNYFEDAEMRDLIEKMENSYHAVMEQNADTALLEELDRLYAKTVPATQKRIAAAIRRNPSEFIQLEA